MKLIIGSRVYFLSTGDIAILVGLLIAGVLVLWRVI